MGKNDFVVDSEGCCFLCLRGTAVQPEPVSATPTYSIQSLSRYLNMDIETVLKQKGMMTTLSHLPAKVDKWILKAELCKECGHLNETFSELNGKMEKIEMEMTLCLRRIQRKMLMCKLGGSKPGLAAESSGKFKFVEGLRMETMHKCFRKLTSTQPRVKVQNLSRGEVNVALTKRKSKTKIVKRKPKTVSRPTNKTAIRSDISIETNVHSAPTTDEMSENNSSSAALELERGESPKLEESYDVKVYKESPRREGHLVSNSPNTVRAHYNNRRTEIGSYVCKFCSREFWAHGKFLYHLKSAHNNLINKCEKCGKKFSTSANCLRHFETVHLHVKYDCTLCDKQFTQRYSLYRHHRDVHTNSPTFSCNVCNHGFKRKTNLIRHLQTIKKCKNGNLKYTSSQEAKKITK